jgi:threonine/homoserine/homoserine lactone efflux protein
MSDVSWVLLAATLLAGAASPGPSLALVLRGSLLGGQSAGLVIALAHGIGVWLYAMAVVLGVATVLLHIDWIMLMVQVLGAVFLCYLGTMMIRSGVASSTEDEQVSQIDSAALPLWRCAKDGFLIVFLNPKIMIFFLAVFSQFLTPGQPLLTQLTAAALAGVIDGLWYALVAVLVSVGRFGERLQRYAAPIDVFFGVILWAISLTILAGQFLLFD